jgi:hypothetical protein
MEVERRADLPTWQRQEVAVAEELNCRDWKDVDQPGRS